MLYAADNIYRAQERALCQSMEQALVQCARVRDAGEEALFRMLFASAGEPAVDA